ncbi:hypothetical protein [Actinoplanes couchii]|uniref:Uncharacterized protein n=1 Tax=Actinoplanes couchii TaxID=403638 RepID=A0ABQ3X3E4_9ACTN|nr:hypothetical protein [Actinoplanes couchii]MDR6322764.1 hypothetical protein [Actinoplanes couchii]GID53003.1 hypothetical protein Aco03nite_014070 [Actinoplanes couchii]
MIPLTSLSLGYDRVDGLLRNAENYRLVHRNAPERPHRLRRWRIRRAR